MEIYNYTIETNLKISKYFSAKNLCFLDIETTGFSRKYNQVYLIGLVYYDKNTHNWNLVQFFANNLNEEKEILNNLNNQISNFDLIVSYNGDNFDLPFIQSRMKHYNIKSKLMNINSFDIYREIRNNESYLELDNMKLKTVEESLGIYRSDEYSGKDCINFYFQYTKTQNDNYKKNILKHNYEDLFYLLEVLRIFDVLKDIKSLSINMDKDILYIEILDIRIKEDILTIVCSTSPLNKKIDIIHYDENFNLKWQNETSLTIDLNIREGLITPTKKCLFINKGEFPINNDLKDLSQYMVPNNFILLKVEKKLIMKNVKNIIKDLVLYVLK